MYKDPLDLYKTFVLDLGAGVGGGSKPSVGQAGCLVEEMLHLIIQGRSEAQPGSGFGELHRA